MTFRVYFKLIIIPNFISISTERGTLIIPFMVYILTLHGTGTRKGTGNRTKIMGPDTECSHWSDTGKLTRPIVFYYASPIPCPGPGPVQCE